MQYSEEKFKTIGKYKRMKTSNIQHSVTDAQLIFLGEILRVLNYKEKEKQEVLN